MLKANRITDGGIPIGLRSEFYTVSSNDNGDYQSIDLSGAREVSFMVDTALGNGGFLTNEPYANSDRFLLSANMNTALVVHSNDDRLFWVAEGAGRAQLYVWVIR